MGTMDVVRSVAFAGVLLAAAAAPSVASDQRTVAPAIPCTSHVGAFRFSQGTPSDPFATFAAAISVSCAPSTSFRLRLRSGGNCHMAAGGASIAYVLYSDLSYTRPILDCSTTSSPELTGRGNQVIMVYGRTTLLTPALRPGDYGDTIFVDIASA